MSDQALKNAKLALQSNNYKRLKENFVSGLLGGTIQEINLVTLTLPVAVFTWSVLQSRRRFFTPYGIEALLADWCIHCGAILFALTVYAGQPLLLNALLVLPALVALLSPPVRRSVAAHSRPRGPAAQDGSSSSAGAVALDALPIRPFVSMYRGMMMVITCAAILAVDFRVFPRRFAKVENWGTSLMDLGVGSFVFSAGVVGARAELKAQDKKRVGFGGRLLASVRQSVALIVLGVIRLISVKGVDYAEHVTEYGVHWNFFFTLSLLPPFVVLCQPVFALVPSYEVIAVTIGVIYELVLDNTTLTAYIIAAPRDNIISQNREGICSFFGYLAIFLAGQGAGMHVLPRDAPAATKFTTLMSRFTVLIKQKSIVRLAISSLIYMALYILLTEYAGVNLRVSRRLANLPYVLWTSAFNTVQLLILILSERINFPNLYHSGSKPPTAADVEDERRRLRAATSPLLRAINRNGLPVFLLANLMTGAVNLGMKTLEAGTGRAMSVLVVYMGIVGAVAVVLDRWDVTIRI